MGLLKLGNKAIYSDGGMERPSQYIQCAANGMLRTADNAGDPFNFGAKANTSFTIAGWFNVPAWGSTAPNRYTEGFFGHGQEFSYFVRMYESASSTNSIFYMSDSIGGNTGGFATNTWYYVFCTLNDTANTQIFRVYTTTGIALSVSGTSANNPVSDATDYFYLGAPRGRTYWAGSTGIQSRFNAVGVWNTAQVPSFADALWNNGKGLSYADLSVAQKTNLVSYWNCDNYNAGTGVVTDNHTNGYNVTAQNAANVSLQTL